MGGNGPPFLPKFLKKIWGKLLDRNESGFHQALGRLRRYAMDRRLEFFSSYSADFALLKHSKASLKLCPATLRATDGPATPGPMLQLE